MEIKFYQTSRGLEPVKGFIEDLQAEAQAKIIRKIDLLEQFGPDLGMPHVKQLESNVYELRIPGRQEVRIFYCFRQDAIYLVHAFVKKTFRTPVKEIETAKRRIMGLTNA